jgi:hypothetical protein
MPCGRLPGCPRTMTSPQRPCQAPPWVSMWACIAQAAEPSIALARLAASQTRELRKILLTTSCAVFWCAGMLRVSGLLPTGCKMLDTPGVPHPHQVGGW